MRKASNIRVRDMTIDDIPTVFAIGNSVFRPTRDVFLYRTWDTYEVTGLFTSDPESCVVAQHENRVVGFALGSTIAKPRSPWIYGYLVWTAVLKEYQGSSIGRKLYAELERRLKRYGARIMIIDTEGSNAGAIRFFSSLGFTKGSQHLWMTKPLRATAKAKPQTKRIRLRVKRHLP